MIEIGHIAKILTRRFKLNVASTVKHLLLVILDVPAKGLLVGHGHVGLFFAAIRAQFRDLRTVQESLNNLPLINRTRGTSVDLGECWTIRELEHNW